jgi:hypothetical protein
MTQFLEISELGLLRDIPVELARLISEKNKLTNENIKLTSRNKNLEGILAVALIFTVVVISIGINKYHIIKERNENLERQKRGQKT